MNEQQKQLNELLLKKQIKEQKQFVTLKEIAEKHLVGYRTLERNLTQLKNIEQLIQQELIYKEPTKQNKWIVHKSIVPLVARRKIYKLIEGAQLEPTLKLVWKHENDLKIFGNVAVNGVYSKTKWDTITHQIFNYYASATDQPIKFIFSYENNKNTFKNNEGFHLHYVCDFPNNSEADLVEQHNYFNEILAENLNEEQMNNYKSCKILKYDHTIRKDKCALAYTTKFTGTDAEVYTGIIAQ